MEIGTGVGRVVVAAMLAAGLAMPGHAGAGEDEAPKLAGFTCCNLHYRDDWISDANWGDQPFLPAGLPIRVTQYGRYRIHVEIDGKAFHIGQDYGRQESLATLARKIVVADDPRPRIASWPEAVRAAVRTGRVRAGMTREQVLVALGYPPAHQTPTLESVFWKHWYSRFGTFVLEWDEKGRVSGIKADAATRALVFVEK